MNKIAAAALAVVIALGASGCNSEQVCKDQPNPDKQSICEKG